MAEQRIILVTGGTSGIGKETVKQLAATGASVVFTARDEAKAKQVREEIIKETGNTGVEYLVCNLASLASVRACADAVKERWSGINVLINNAGVLPQERQESEDGIELNLAVNFLAPFLLTNLLLPLLKANAPARVINVSSSMHTEGDIDFADLEGKNHFDKYKAYAQSKLALLLFTRKLARDLKGTGVTANALHPGVVGTEMTMRNVRGMNPVTAFVFKRTLISPAQGAETSVYLATSPEVAEVSGAYFDKKKAVPASPLADDKESAEKLWDIAETNVMLYK
ncbi:MAG TPA: SDR family oxidoreductase [Candidatus Paceibacterota bacterium]|nr:SDR family oxidoreductase [Candidatus Paceibacterota bacterium]